MTPRTQPFAQVGDVYQAVITGRVYKVVDVIPQDCHWSPWMYILQSQYGAISVAGNWIDDPQRFARLAADQWRERRTIQMTLF